MREIFLVRTGQKVIFVGYILASKYFLNRIYQRVIFATDLDVSRFSSTHLSKTEEIFFFVAGQFSRRDFFKHFLETDYNQL